MILKENPITFWDEKCSKTTDLTNTTAANIAGVLNPDSWGWNWLSSESLASIRHTNRLAKQLEEYSAEIIKLYKNIQHPVRLIDIAKKFLPAEIVKNYPNQCARAVGVLLKKHLGEEYNTLREKHRAQTISKTLKTKDLWQQKKPENIKRVPYSQSEDQYFLELLSNPDYQHQKWPWKWKPDWKKIAFALNQKFHNWIAVRTPTTLKTKACELKAVK